MNDKIRAHMALVDSFAYAHESRSVDAVTARAAVEASAIALHAEQPDDLHIAYMAGFADGKKARLSEPLKAPEPVGEREAFEAWCQVGDASPLYPQLKRDELGYTNSVIAACWEAWQAARSTKGST